MSIRNYFAILLLCASIYCDVSSTPASWSFTGATSSSALIGLVPSGEYIVSGRAITNGDAVGAFYRSGNDTLCAGYFVWNGTQFGFAASGDDATTALKDGFANGETFIFKIWDAAKNVEMDAKPVYLSGSNTYTPDGVSVLSSLVCGETFSVQLRPGWNMVSIPIALSDSSFLNSIASIAPSVMFAMNQSGSIYSQNQSNQIDYWRSGDAIVLYLSRADTLLAIGRAIQSDTVFLSTGWNTIPCLARGSEATIVEYFNSISDKLVAVTDDLGRVYFPAFGINTIGTVSNGKAYKVFVKQSCVLVTTIAQ